MNKFRDATLTPAGREQARLVGKFVKNVIPESMQPTVFVASVLTRAIETALIAAHDMPESFRVVVTPRVRELLGGAAQKPRELKDLQAYLKRWYANDYARIDWRFVTDESMHAVIEQSSASKSLDVLNIGRRKWDECMRFLQRKDPIIMVFSHGRFLENLLDKGPFSNTSPPSFHNTAVWYDGKFIYQPLITTANAADFKECEDQRDE